MYDQLSRLARNARDSAFLGAAAGVVTSGGAACVLHGVQAVAVVGSLAAVATFGACINVLRAQKD